MTQKRFAQIRKFSNEVPCWNANFCIVPSVASTQADKKIN